MAKVFCPNCSAIANPLHRASTIGTATGITAGGATVIVGMVRGARAGSALGVVGTTIAAVACGILNLLWEVTSGSLLGAVRNVICSSRHKQRGLLQNLEVCNSPFERKNGGAF